MVWRAFAAVTCMVCALGMISPVSSQTDNVLEPEVHLPAEADVLPDKAANHPLNLVTIPKLTPVAIEIRTLLGTKISTSGDKFLIRLAEAIIIDGQEVVPAGTEGEGEVIHAKKGGGMGSAGELVLAARYLIVDGRQLPLRSMKFVALGKDNIGTSTALGITLGLPGLFISGGNTEVPVGTLASAMTREDFSMGPVVEAVKPSLPPENSQIFEVVEVGEELSE